MRGVQGHVEVAVDDVGMTFSYFMPCVGSRAL